MTLIITRIGYRAKSLPATVGATDVAILLSVVALRLDELVVTGQAGDTRKRALGNPYGPKTCLPLPLSERIAAGG